MSTRAVIITIGPWHEKPWWWEHIRDRITGCNVGYVRIGTIGNRKEGQLSLIHLPLLFIKIIQALRKHKPGYVFTFECGVSSFLVAAMQTFGFMRSARHIILQFIMREQEKSLRSRLKYLFMRFIFSSIDTAVCSSTGEVSYYQEAFKWKEGRTRFVPFHSDPQFLQVPYDGGEGYILTAGRTFRDYETFLNAVREIGHRVIMVASPRNIDKKTIPENVSLKYDITMAELTDLMRKSDVVVVPLEDRKISIGQSIFLQAMAMGKAVVVTKTAGTVDYIDHQENGMLVPPRDSQQMREAIQYLMENEGERIRIGKNARIRVAESYLPCHYYERVRQLVLEKEALRKKSRGQRRPSAEGNCMR